MSRTNFQKIKDMSVEEMVDFLVKVSCTNYAPCMIIDEDCKYFPNVPENDEPCKYCFKEWLEREVEG